MQKIKVSIKTLEEKVKENERILSHKCEKKMCKKIFKKIKKSEMNLQTKIEKVSANIGEKSFLLSSINLFDVYCLNSRPSP